MMPDAQMDLVSTPQNSSARAKRNTQPTNLQLYRCMILYRFLLAGVGGYILSALTAIVIAQSFADHASSAATSATMLAFVIHTAAFIWVFMVNKTLQASLGIVIPSILLWSISKWMGA